MTNIQPLLPYEFNAHLLERKATSDSINMTTGNSECEKLHHRESDGVARLGKVMDNCISRPFWQCRNEEKACPLFSCFIGKVFLSYLQLCYWNFHITISNQQGKYI